MLTLFPEELDSNSYRARYKDLATKSDEELKRHWDIYGIKENRCGSAVTKVQELLPVVGNFLRILEIGPFDNPFIEPLRGTCDIYYADRLNQEELTERANKYSNRNSSNIPYIDYKAIGDFSKVIPEEFDCVVSNNLVEHIPDILSHFLDMSQLLKKGGTYLFIVPDKMRMFDHFIPETLITEVMAAFIEKRLKPTLRSVIEHRAYTVKNFKDRKASPFYSREKSILANVERAITEYTDSDYCDVHCSFFTHYSLRNIISILRCFEWLPASLTYRSYYLDDQVCMAMQFFPAPVPL